MRIDPRIRDLYKALLDGGLPVVLAGGACRDLYHGTPPKDYDFLVLGSDWLHSGAATFALGRELADDGTYRAIIQQSYSGNLRCGDVWEFEYSGLKVNVIFPCLDGDGAWADMQSVIDHFDTSLNAIGYDFDTDEYVLDPRFTGLTNKVSLISDPDRIGYERTLKRYNRLQEKYPFYDWSEVTDYLNRGGAIDFQK